MTESAQYITFLSSLPKPRHLEKLKVVPISILRLEKRLLMLPAKDRVILARIRSLLSWHDASHRNLDENEFILQANQLLQDLQDPELLELISRRLEIRTLVAALRLRHRGQKAENLPKKWGFGTHIAQLKKNWNIIDFGLGKTYHWLPEAAALLKEGRARELENLLLLMLWKELDKVLYRQHYNLAAVVAYILNWSIADRWTRYNTTEAASRFSKLVNHTLEAEILELNQTSKNTGHTE